MFRWAQNLGRSERRAFAAAFGGYGLDAFDTMMFSLILPALIGLWGLSKGEAGLIGSAALVASAVGGWLAGILADRFGRVRILQLTILWFSVFTFLSAFAQNFGQLLSLRILEGLGFGGEWSVGAVLIAESVGPEHRGKIVGWVQSSWAIGWGLAALAATLAFQILPAAASWRVLFGLGALPALFILFIRRHVEEPKVYVEAKTAQVRASSWTIFSALFAPRLLPTTLWAALLTTGAQGGYYSLTTWLPTYLKTVRGLSNLSAGGSLGMIILGAFCGYVTGAYLCDWLGRRLKFCLFALGSGVTVWAYIEAPLTGDLALWLGFPLGFFSSGVFSGMGAFLAELFPSDVRASGQGFAYNFGRGVGALFPGLIGFLADRLGLGLGVALFASGAYAVMLFALLFLPETKGRDLSL